MDVTGNIRLWDVPERKQLASIGDDKHEVKKFTFSRDGKRLFVLNDHAILTFDTGTGQQLAEFSELPGGPIFFATDASDKRMLVGARDGAVIVWNLQTFATDFALPSRGSPAYGGVVSEDGKRAAIYWLDGAISIWDLKSWPFNRAPRSCEQPTR